MKRTVDKWIQVYNKLQKPSRYSENTRDVKKKRHFQTSKLQNTTLHTNIKKQSEEFVVLICERTPEIGI